MRMRNSILAFNELVDLLVQFMENVYTKKHEDVRKQVLQLAHPDDGKGWPKGVCGHTGSLKLLSFSSFFINFSNTDDVV